MTLANLIAAFRVTAYDQIEPYIWSDADIAGHLADAENEACIRARLIADETTADVAVVPIGTAAWIDLSPTLIDVTRARLASNPDTPLAQCPPDALDALDPGWETNTGTPTRYYVLGGRLRLIPQPVAASDTLYLRVYRIPLSPLSESDLDAEPEIPEPHHVRLLDWALHRAYMKRDEEVFDSNRSALHRQLFEENFGPRPSASAIRQQAAKRWPLVKPIAF